MIWDLLTMMALPASARQPGGVDIEAAFRDHGAFIGRVIMRFLGDGPHVDDLLQDTFLTAFRKRDNFEGRSELRTWLYGIASNLCSRHRRSVTRLDRFKGKLAVETPEDSPSPERELRRSQGAALLHRAIESLPFKHKEVFVLYELEELEGREISELLDVPLGTVWTRLHKARKLFEKQVAKLRAGEMRP
jgi:RNA polymerase sigma-70 factor (ECF subfamily)